MEKERRKGEKKSKGDKERWTRNKKEKERNEN